MPTSRNSVLPSPAADFDSLPDCAIIRQPALTAVLSISPSTVWRLVGLGVLKPVKLSKRVTGWRVGDVRAYLASLDSKAG